MCATSPRPRAFGVNSPSRAAAPTASAANNSGSRQFALVKDQASEASSCGLNSDSRGVASEASACSSGGEARPVREYAHAAFASA